MISIIIPVYNTGIKLERCLESIIHQDYNDLEILIINDGSTDTETLLICSKFEGLDKRVKLVNKKNGGVSAARNEGIRLAQGKNIMFVDSDDYIETSLCRKLYKGVEGNKYGMGLCGVSREFRFSKKPVKKVGILPSCKNIDNDQMFKEQFGPLYEKSLFVSVFAKLYDVNIIREKNITFKEKLNLGEDMLFNLEYFGFSRTVYIVDECLYHYVNDEQPSLTKNYNFKNFDIRKFLFENSFQFVEQLGSSNSIKPYLCKIYLRGCFRNIESISLNGSGLKLKEKINFIKAITSDNSTVNALKYNTVDIEHAVYKIVLKLNISSLTIAFSFLRQNFKKLTRGGVS